MRVSAADAKSLKVSYSVALGLKISMLAGVLHVGSTAAPELGPNDLRIRCAMLVNSIRCCTLLYLPVLGMAMYVHHALWWSNDRGNSAGLKQLE